MLYPEPDRLLHLAPFLKLIDASAKYTRGRSCLFLHTRRPANPMPPIEGVLGTSWTLHLCSRLVVVLLIKLTAVVPFLLIIAYLELAKPPFLFCSQNIRIFRLVSS